MGNRRRYRNRSAAHSADCDLSDFADRLMNELSGGERQRVVLARGLATGANVLLLDEPTANLDLAHQAMMFRLVRERCREYRPRPIVITHDLNLAAEFADRVLLLSDGRLFARGRRRSFDRRRISELFGVNVLLDENPVSGNVRVTGLYLSKFAVQLACFSGSSYELLLHSELVWQMNTKEVR